MGQSGLTIWRYRRRFAAGGRDCEVRIRSSTRGLESRLFVAGEVLAEDFTPAVGPEAVRNHRLEAALPDGTRLEVEAGYINSWNVGIAVRQDGRPIHESHPGKTIAYPPRYAKIVANPDTGKSDIDFSTYERNKVPILVDVLLGLLFFLTAKLTDISTAAIVGAAAGVALLVAQRFVKVDLIGGLALFGVVLLLASGTIAILFQDEWAVKMRSTFVMGLSATLFLVDALFGGKRLGKGLARYLPYSDIHHGRLALGMGLVGIVMAATNVAVVEWASTDVWLYYTTFFDFMISLALIMLVMRYARTGRILPHRRPNRDPDAHRL